MQPEQNPDARHAEWRTLALNPATDIPLYRSPRNSLADNSRLHRGTDLLAHKAPSTCVYYYLWHWSVCANESNICQLTSEESAVGYIRELFRTEVVVTGLEHENLMDYLPDLYWPRAKNAVDPATKENQLICPHCGKAYAEAGGEVRLGRDEMPDEKVPGEKLPGRKVPGEKVPVEKLPDRR
ncbi:MAG: hypothetical protein GYA23_10920 [Methanomicrobiales archaeon]|nr:hypothetical protein [Methanomicrobiales archaeon]